MTQPRLSYLNLYTTDPAWNLAAEQYVFDALPRDRTYFMLWQNDNAIIIGKHQNAAAEIDQQFVRENGVRVVRRLSGGGAAPFSPVRSSTASVKLLPKNSMTKSTGPPPLLWLCLYHLFPRTVKLSCRFQRYSFPARVSCSPCDCRKETRSAWLARSICSWV